MRGTIAQDKKSGKGGMGEDVIQLVTFLVGSEEYGLAISGISEAVRPLKITPLPRMPEFVEGVVNLRGVIIPIVDLRKRFALSGAAGNPKKMRILITRGAFAGMPGRAGELLGLVVDGVNDVLLLPRKDIEPAPQAAMGANVGFITGVGKTGDRLIILIEITKILSQQERSALAEAENAGS